MNVFIESKFTNSSFPFVFPFLIKGFRSPYLHTLPIKKPASHFSYRGSTPATWFSCFQFLFLILLILHPI
ncbi:hypothetical protein V8C44DRAFT_109079 [Trichoderma aethiopicum]